MAKKNDLYMTYYKMTVQNVKVDFGHCHNFEQTIALLNYTIQEFLVYSSSMLY